jgi:hypothetical protein
MRGVKTILLVGMVVGLTGRAQAQERDISGEHATMVEHADMMARMKAADARLDSLVGAMSAAEGADRVEVIADLLAQLVARKDSTCPHMAMMHGMQEGGPMHEGGTGHEHGEHHRKSGGARPR